MKSYCVLGALASFLVTGALAQTTLQTFDDKAAFLAATGATNATGPLPPLGLKPAGTKVGTITFGGLTGKRDLYIGILLDFDFTYWYPPIPAHLIARAGADWG